MKRESDRGVGMFAAVLGLLGLVMLGLSLNVQRSPAGVDSCPGCGIVASAPATDTPRGFGETP